MGGGGGRDGTPAREDPALREEAARRQAAHRAAVARGSAAAAARRGSSWVGPQRPKARSGRADVPRAPGAFIADARARAPSSPASEPRPHPVVGAPPLQERGPLFTTPSARAAGPCCRSASSRWRGAGRARYAVLATGPTRSRAVPRRGRRAIANAAAHTHLPRLDGELLERRERRNRARGRLEVLSERGGVLLSDSLFLFSVWPRSLTSLTSESRLYAVSC